ncbi:MAG: hypothetical protein ACLQDV_07630 [Candidatus Binataceae bacterium]
MAKGKQLGEFSLKFTSLAHTPGPAGSVVIQGNCEGSATGFGTVLGTASFVGGKSGTLSWCSNAYLENGEQLSSVGSGTFENSGKHRWRTQAFLQISDGRSLVSEGEIELANRSWVGKIFENS